MKNRRGFTLIEMAVSLAILGAILLSVSLFMKPMTDLWGRKLFQDDSQQESRLGLLKMMREMGQIRDSTSVAVAESQRIQFQNAAGQTITYQLSGSQILRNNRALAKNVGEFTLSYWNKAHQTVASPLVSPASTDIYRIGALIRTDKGGSTATARSQVRPRNLYG